MSNVTSFPITTRREAFAGGLTLRIDESGSGQPVLFLHGGGGPQSIASFAQILSAYAHVLLPVHPGFAGEPRPDWYNGIDDLAITYLELLERLDLENVLVVGSSMGGWIAAEMAVRNTTRISKIILIDAIGIEVADQPVANVFTLTRDELMALSYHNPTAFRIDPTTLSPQQIAGMAANFQALGTYAPIERTTDPKLIHHLNTVKIPALVVWGESDRVATPEYGQAFAEALPNGRFELIKEAGHMPQMEQPAQLLKLIQEFTGSFN